MEVSGIDSSNTETGNSRFLIVNHRTGGVLDAVRFVVSGKKESGEKFLQYSDGGVLEELPGDDDTPDHRWVIFVSIIVRKLIAIFGKPMEWFGYLVDFILNLLSLNGNFLGLLYNILHGKSNTSFSWDHPQDSKNFLFLLTNKLKWRDYFFVASVHTTLTDILYVCQLKLFCLYELFGN